MEHTKRSAGLFVVACMAAWASAWAWPGDAWVRDSMQETVGGVVWEYHDTADGESILYGGCPNEGELVIPPILGGLPVTEIGARAFMGVRNLRKVTFPETIRRIGPDSFNHCADLEEVILPDSVEEIGAFAFARCYQVTNVVMGKNVEFIDSSAFSECTELGSVAVGEKVEIIPARAFDGCTALTNVLIPEGVYGIGDCAFSQCGKLKEVTLPASMEFLASGAFEGCSALADVWFEGEPPSVENHGVFLDVAPGARGHVREEHLGAWAEAFREYAEDREEEREAVAAARAWLRGRGIAVEADRRAAFEGNAWYGLVLTAVDRKAEPGGGVVRLHRNAWSRNGSEPETVDLPFVFGEPLAFPENPFPGVERELYGWAPGEPVEAPIFRWDEDECHKGELTITEKSLEEAGKKRWVEDRDGMPILHLYGEWMTEVTVRFFTATSVKSDRDTPSHDLRYPLLPADTGHHVFFRFAREGRGAWHSGGETVALPPGKHLLECRPDAAMAGIVEGWGVDDPTVDGGIIEISSIHDEAQWIPAPHDPEAALELNVRLVPAGGQWGFTKISWRAETTDGQLAACPEFPAFDPGKVTVHVVSDTPANRLRPLDVPPLLALEADRDLPLPPGRYRARAEYADRTGKGSFETPFWLPEGGQEFGFTVSTEEFNPVVLVFRPFGSAEPCWRVTFDGNGGVPDFADMWYQRFAGWKGGAPMWLGREWGRDIPGAKREGNWAFAGWFSGRDGGKLSGRLDLERRMGMAPENLLFRAHWSGERIQTVVFDANQGTCEPSTARFAMGEPYGPLPMPERDGYAPLGWFTRRSGGVAVGPEDIVMEETERTLYAHWEAVGEESRMPSGEPEPASGGRGESSTVRYLHLLAEQGEAPAQFFLGVRYMQGNGVPQSREEATKWLRKAAEQGHPQAARFLEPILSAGDAGQGHESGGAPGTGPGRGNPP